MVAERQAGFEAGESRQVARQRRTKNAFDARSSSPALLHEDEKRWKVLLARKCSIQTVLARRAQEEHCHSSSNSGKGARLRAAGLAFHTVTLRSVNARREGRPARSLDSEQCERYPLRVEQVEQTV
jgi:hypothetical protein